MPRTVLIDRQRVGAGALGFARDRRDVGDVRRELDDERLVGRRARRAHDARRSDSGSHANVSPSLATFGHEMFSSIAAISSRAASRSHTYA